MSTPGRATIGPTSANEPTTEAERIVPEHAVPDRAGPDRAGPDRIELDRTEADRPEYRAPEVAVGPDAIAPEPAARTTDDAAAPLFSRDTADELWRRWDAIQAGFVDEPRRAVQDADTLVDDIVKRLAESFAQARTRLEQRWDRGDNVSTEDLRLALQQYRSFFKRLLAV